MNQTDHEILLMVLSEVKDIKRMQEHQGGIVNQLNERMDGVDQRLAQMERKLDEVYELSLDNYGAIQEHETHFRLLEGRVETLERGHRRTVRRMRRTAGNTQPLEQTGQAEKGKREITLIEGKDTEQE
ncbi:MAG: hypothetical protein J6C19_11640 [Lachnospiraceae bacterium]|nr:hypothetical protein [Lachnospiraceae bacterium]MBO5291763.1 hypothetical protein [Lachnospiraceae bacterium]